MVWPFFSELLRTERIRHNDLHLENIMVARDGLYLVDLHKTDVLKDSAFPAPMSS